MRVSITFPCLCTFRTWKIARKICSIFIYSGKICHFETHMGKKRLDCDQQYVARHRTVTVKPGNVPSVKPFSDFVPFHGSSHLSHLSISPLHNSHTKPMHKTIIQLTPRKSQPKFSAVSWIFRHKNLAFCGKLSFVVNLRQIFLPAPPDVALGLRHFATRKIKFYIPIIIQVRISTG